MELDMELDMTSAVLWPPAAAVRHCI